MKTRTGAALIIAISVLAALLFLALPFLFSQSASVAGARAASWDGVARRSTDRAGGLAAALAVYATTLHRSAQMGAARLAYVQVPLQLDSPDMVNYRCFSDGAHRAVLNSDVQWQTNGSVIPALDGTNSTHGMIIEDESRRIDPNCLGEYAWAQVLARAGIIDPPTLYWSWNPMPGGTGVYAHGRWVQASYGRLARRLALWRPANATRYNRIEDLLGANPDAPTDPSPRTAGCIPTWPKGYDRSTGAPYWPTGASEAEIEATRNAGENNIPHDFKDPLQPDFATKIIGYRVAALTPAELDRLKTQLTFLVPGQGRSGMIDLATVVAVSDVDENYDVTHDDLPPDGSLQMGPPLRTSTSWATTIQARIGRSDDRRWQEVDDALAITATPALNINTVKRDSELVRLFSVDPVADGWPDDPVNAPITSIGHLPRLAWLDPRLGNSASFYDPNIGSSTSRFERPPVGLLGYGTMAIEGAANALDAEGRQVGQRRRRAVMQTVPQEHALEGVWSTQGEIEALLLARHGSWVQSGPLPTRRISTYGQNTDGTPDTVAMLALDKAGWLEAAPVCSFGTNTSIPMDWWVPFGLTQPTAWDRITYAFSGTGARPQQSKTTAPSEKPAQQTALDSDIRPLADGTPGRMTSQGLRLLAGERIAWEMGAKGPLRGTTNGDQLDPRHVSFRFRLDAVASGTTVLMEARATQPGADSQNAFASGSGLPDAGFGEPDAVTEDQFVWRLHYDKDGPGGEQLVLVVANGALPWRAADRTRFGITGSWTHQTDAPAQDEDGRCIPGGSLPFAPAWQAQRVEYRYRVAGGLEAGRWYQVQVASGGDQPGHQAIILDGIVGRDAILAKAFDTTGDHYVFPSLRLLTALAAQPFGTTGNANLVVGDLKVAVPPGLTASDVLPSRGIVRIDDEFLSYDSIVGDVLKGVQRGRRQETYQGATKADPLDASKTVADEDFRWPILQEHLVNALVVPGWSQLSFNDPTSQWRFGAGMLVGPTDALQDGLPEQPPAASVMSMVTNAANQPTEVTIAGKSNDFYAATGLPVFAFGNRGYVRFYSGTSGSYSSQGTCYFTRAAGDNKLTLDWTRPECSGICDSTTTLVLQITIEIDEAVAVLPNGRPRFSALDADAEPRIGSAGMLQLLDRQDGRVEWISYGKWIDLAAAGRFFWQHDGFGRNSAASINPSTMVRGAMRTPWRKRASDPWPGKGLGAGTVILPVQTRFTTTSRLEAGDVVTMVPDDLRGGSRQAPVQLLVRYACRDGFAATSGVGHDTQNDYFALAHQVPIILSTYTGKQTMLIGRGWGGGDLSPQDNTETRRGAMPEMDGLGDVVAAKNPALHFGSGQPDPARTGDYSSPASVSILVDDLCAGGLAWAPDYNQAEIVGVVSFGTTPVNTLSAASDQLPTTVTTVGNVFKGCPTYGLVLLDGEVFAYRQMDPPEDNRARLIARGLLGSTPIAHTIPADVALPTQKIVPPPAGDLVQNALAILTLPIGPVGELVSEIKPQDQGTYLDVVEIPHTSYFRDPPAPGFTKCTQNVYAATENQRLPSAPYQLIQDPITPANFEVLRLLDYPTQANQLTVAPWLRGLFGSTTQHWQPGFTGFAQNRPTAWVDQDPKPAGPGARIITLNDQPAKDTNLNPIIIGFWPRFAAGIPRSLPSSALHASALLRCRSYAWAGFPLRFYGGRFDPSITALATNGVADVQVADAGGLRVETRALAAGDGLDELFDWSSSPVGATGSALKTPFAWSRFQMREVDGAELRVHWAVPSVSTATLESVADAGGRTPRLGATDTAVGKDPAVGSGVRLRCVAPTRTLAIEEVR